ncbi:unnamed protein product [Pieris macdunnoughi]|uniref:Uncharacterized protein n=1 Tax=Pieris macdunnoughi TaxID=345717 RepID=A0A821S2H3_9NEOP|nr:unnamed protein product [Pieris macdunnoughi]
MGIPLSSTERLTALGLLTATGQHITVRGEGIATFKIGGRTYRHEVVIADIVDDCIIGLDFMKHYNCKIDLKNGTFKCRDEVVSLKDNTLKNGYDVYRAIIEDGTFSKQRDIVQAGTGGTVRKP